MSCCCSHVGWTSRPSDAVETYSTCLSLKNEVYSVWIRPGAESPMFAFVARSSLQGKQRIAVNKHMKSFGWRCVVLICCSLGLHSRTPLLYLALNNSIATSGRYPGLILSSITQVSARSILNITHPSLFILQDPSAWSSRITCNQAAAS
jgi:hypothetical protein